MKSAIRLFAAQGFDATTTLQISREVGVTEPTIFYHFKNKQHFFNTILEDALSRYPGRLEQLNLSGPTAFGCIEEILKSHFKIVEDETHYLRNAEKCRKHCAVYRKYFTNRINCCWNFCASVKSLGVKREL